MPGKALNRYKLAASYCEVPPTGNGIVRLNSEAGMVLAVQSPAVCDLAAAGTLESDSHTYVIMPSRFSDKQGIDSTEVGKPFTVWELPKREKSGSVAGILDWIFRH